MRKEYFFVSPSNFARMGEINIDGDFDYVQFTDFKVEEPRENYLFFEVRYEYYENKRVFSPVAREVITGRRFDLKVQERKNRRTGEVDTTAVLSSEELGLYSRIMNVADIERKPSRLSGIFCHFQDHPEDKENYCWQLKEMFEEAQSYKQAYDSSIDGPSKQLTSQMKRTYRRTKVDKMDK